MSGVHMLPMVFGMLLSSTASGQIVSRTGRWKVFPVAGTGVTALVCCCSTSSTRTAPPPR